MMKNILTLAVFILVFSLWGNALHARFGTLEIETSAAPVVVELFTSQGCSSCPPADRVLDELAQHDNIIALGYHVTYWDRLGWRDTLGQSFADERQRSYSRAQNSRRVYTPQMVVNGTEEFVGSRKSDASKHVSRAGKSKKVKAIAINTSGNQLNIALPKLAKMGDYKLWVVGYKKSHSENVGAGELRGRNLQYANSVLTLDTLGSWAGESMTHTFTRPSGDIDGIAIIAQKINHGPVIAAGKIEF